ncbi:hypothetical protein QBC43DRAFT_367749 [Cladorrhinum sp. PSN259]|nr:hypothetical protein QBC43DRAFT_367749 [Cladorrhinum sp. PSN259]
MLLFSLLFLSLGVVARLNHKEDGDCAFHLTGLTNANVTVGQLPGGQVTGGNFNNTAALFHLIGAGLWDDEGRGCWWADPSTVLVCDILPPDGPDSLFQIAEDGCLHYNGTSTFYACKSGRYGRVNYYLEQRDATCRPAFLVADDTCGTQPFGPVISTVMLTSTLSLASTSSFSTPSTSYTARNTFTTVSDSSTFISWSTRPTPSSPSPRLPPGVTTRRPSLTVSGTGTGTGDISVAPETPIWQNTTWQGTGGFTSVTSIASIVWGNTTTTITIASSTPSSSTSTTTSTITAAEIIPIVTYTVWKTTHVHTPGGPVTVTTVTVTQGVDAAQATAFAVEVIEVGVGVGDDSSQGGQGQGTVGQQERGGGGQGPRGGEDPRGGGGLKDGYGAYEYVKENVGKILDF